MARKGIREEMERGWRKGGRLVQLEHRVRGIMERWEGAFKAKLRIFYLFVLGLK